MTHESEQALKNALAFEAKKDGLAQRQSGDWVLRIVNQAADMDQRIINAPMGARFQCVMVEIGDDEQAVDHVAIDRGRWRDLGATKQSVLRCKNAVFWAFLSEERGLGDEVNEIGAANYVRDHCGIQSRSDLDKPGHGEARRKWYELDNVFQAWRYKENA
jgi:hypothetical protein